NWSVRRSQGSNGRSYEQVIQDVLRGNPPRRVTKRQLHWASHIYKWVSVDRVGQIHLDGHKYGDMLTQNDLPKFHGACKTIVLGRDPGDFNLPAFAHDSDCHLIRDAIQPVNVEFMTAWNGPEGPLPTVSKRGKLCWYWKKSGVSSHPKTGRSMAKSLMGFSAPKQQLRPWTAPTT
ncbi:MAG: hypothetical protein AAGF13_11095, partial [Pseudomonadota bacterium]